MIKSFANKSTQRIWEGQQVKGFSVEVQTVALRKMQMIHAATRLESLRIPPGNRLKPLQGKRSGEHSIRVNDQFRICFKWDEGNALDVVLEDSIDVCVGRQACKSSAFVFAKECQLSGSR